MKTKKYCKDCAHYRTIIGRHLCYSSDDLDCIGRRVVSFCEIKNKKFNCKDYEIKKQAPEMSLKESLRKIIW